MGLFFITPNDPAHPTNAPESISEDYPNEYMYNQRAYPDNVFNTKAMDRAIAQSNVIRSNRQSQANDWELVGPLNTGGRITDIAIAPDDNDRFYISTAVGGVFRTTDRGANWESIFDEIGKPSIGNIEIAPSDANRIYVGTGEANASATSGAFFGDGIYRSDDGGDSWTNMGLTKSEHIGRIVVDPTDPDRVFAAATGRLYGKNNERGIYRTLDGGSEWEQVLFVTDSTSAIDVVLNPIDTDIVFAAMWERTRKPWQRDYGGETSAIHRSLDGGDTWELLENGLPAVDAQTGRIGLSISASNPDVVYARYTTNEITNQFDAIYKSEDSGDSWAEVPTGTISNIDASFGWYFGNLRVDPNDPNEVYVLGQGIARTRNGGQTWQSVNGMHVDHHALEYSRTDDQMILAGNDGGLYLSENNGATWNKYLNLPITQFYNIEVDFQEPTHLYGGTQDNNTIRTLTEGTSDWNSILGGDGFQVSVDPTDNNFVYAESQNGGLARSTDGGNSFQSATSGIASGDRNNWNTPYVISNFDASIVYTGTNRLYSSTRAVNWTVISPDLTDGQHPSGSTSFGTLTAVESSYLNLNTIYTGSDDGNVNVTFDGGGTWENISSGLPNRSITALAISPVDDDVVYVTISGYRSLDYDPHVFKSEDGGQNWIDISSNLPGIPANDIIIATVNGSEYLFVGTDLNVWYSSTDGAAWDILGNDLPLTIIRDLKYHEPTETLYVGTFGRSMHQYDLSDFVLSTEDVALAAQEVNIYPVPAVNNFTIDHTLTGEGSITLYDVQGKEVKRLFDGALSQAQNRTFLRADLASGMYLVRVQSQSIGVTKKIIIK
jgi:photosystem II stability/assembly factor-like uncharacterized protein